MQTGTVGPKGHMPFLGPCYGMVLAADLSRYPPPMMEGLAGAISQALSDIGQEASKPMADWTHQHPSANDELPFRQQVRHMDHGVDRPTSLPLAHRISLMDEHVVVQLGFRTRPLRDGGGKPSHGDHIPGKPDH